MKLIITVLKDIDNDPVSQALVGAGYRVTRIASTGGFFRRGSTTLMIGVEDQNLDDAIGLIRKATTPMPEPGEIGTTIFVLKVDQFLQI
jgi:uncharacterized protein YaaQ